MDVTYSVHEEFLGISTFNLFVVGVLNYCGYGDTCQGLSKPKLADIEQHLKAYLKIQISCC